MERAHLVERAVNGWIDQLTDLSGRNNLLYYRDLRQGTLDLATASDPARRRLLEGRKVRCSHLFPDPALQADAVSRLKSIHRKMKELSEERGIHAGYIAAGMASWREDRKSPAAPIILRKLSITPTTPARDDFELAVDDESVINPVLLYKLRADFRLSIPADQLEELAGDTIFDSAPVYDRLREITIGVPGFTIESRLIAGTFTYAKLPMVQDLQESVDLLVATDMIAALAGDPRAEQAIRTLETGQGAAADGHRPPKDEYLVLDADSSQAAAINAVLRGRNLVIQGPPGTGKSQTIANMIASLVAEGKHVLFVAEKRAAIDAVTQRLERLKLSGLVLDIHDGVQNKRRMAQELDTAVRAVGQVAVPDVAELHRRLSDRIHRSNDHAAVMHESRSPWGISLFDAQARLLRIPDQRRSTVRLRNDALLQLTSEVVDQVHGDIREYASLPDLVHRPWLGADIRTLEQAQLASDSARRLEIALNTERARLRTLSAALGCIEPATFAEWASMYSVLVRISKTCQLLGTGIYGHDIAAMATATARRGERQKRLRATPRAIKLGWSARRALRKEAEGFWKSGPRSRNQLFLALVSAEEELMEWRRHGFTGGPTVPSGWSAAAIGFGELRNYVEKLDSLFPGAPLGRMQCENLSSIASQLAADGDSPQHLARLAELSARLTRSGLKEIVGQIAASRMTPEDAITEFESAWYASIIDYVRLTDRRCDTLGGADLSRIVDELRQYDTEHLKRNAERVRRIAAERACHAQDTHPEQASLLRREAGKARKHLPLRDLLVRAPDVLLALKPCWAISPIVVSQVLPPRRLFDVVIFDEASQVKQADAVPSIIRASQVVVAGDKKQLPPTDFFSSAADDEDAEDYSDALRTAAGEAVVTRTGGAFESILDTLATLLADASLTWHYRSRDERLIAFSNQHFYQPKMTTFPGIGEDHCLVHIVAEQAAGVAGQEQSVTAEVDRVVTLILDHARTRPDESLGVITLGLPHMRRIEAKLDAALRSRGDVAEFFAEKDVENSFFVKNLERVQGDERDAIILSTGFGKTADGRMRYSWGPLLREGGERRLNVAVTRARKRLTLVTAFRAEDADPSRVTREGGKLLCDYLRYADSGGGDPGASGAEDPPLNPFELDVLERLQNAGIPVIPQYGVGGMRIDFAAQHPQFPGRMVLAIEADGASYHSSRNARDRDRLRQEHLERLGWRFHRIWSTDWFNNPHREIAKVRAAYEQAIARSGPNDGARQPPQSPETPSQHQQETPPVRRKPRPQLEQGLTTDKYDPRDLSRLAEWIESDGILRTEEEVLAEMTHALGRQRKTEKFDVVLRGAIRTARSRR
jgi:very-short-patch-repair endonuclease